MSHHQNSPLAIQREKEIIKLFGYDRNAENAVLHYYHELKQIVELERTKTIYLKNLNSLGLTTGDLRVLKRANLISRGQPRGMKSTDKLKVILKKIEPMSRAHLQLDL